MGVVSNDGEDTITLMINRSSNFVTRQLFPECFLIHVRKGLGGGLLGI
jgi:hypothetical protein